MRLENKPCELFLLTHVTCSWLAGMLAVNLKATVVHQPGPPSFYHHHFCKDMQKRTFVCHFLVWPGVNTCIYSLYISQFLLKTICIGKCFCYTIQWTILSWVYMWNVYTTRTEVFDSNMDKSVHSQTTLQHSVLTGWDSAPTYSTHREFNTS